jgi:trimeric autotransporter adhesin
MRRFSLLLGALAVMLALTAAPAYAATPTAATGSASNIGENTATVGATVNAEGNTVLECTFDYGTTTSYGSTSACSSTPSGTTNTAVTANLTGLAAATPYHFRISITYLSLALSLSSPLVTLTGDDASFTTASSTGAVPPSTTTTAASSVFSTSAQLNGTVTPGTDALSSCEFMYGTSASSLTSSAACAQTSGGNSIPAGTSPVTVSAAIGDLTASTQYYYELVAVSGAGTSPSSTPQTFTTTSTAATMPTATTATPPTNVSYTTATVSGTVNTQGAAVGSCVFEYGTSTAYGQTSPCTPTPSSSSTTAQTVSANLTGLSTGTVYHYRVAILTGGGPAVGGDQTFTTLGAAAETVAPASLSATSAILQGGVYPDNQTITGCAFVYGTTTSYGNTAFCTPSSISGATPVEVKAGITGLSPSTTYHYELIVTTSNGTAYGGDVAFTTGTGPTGATLPATRVSAHGSTLHGRANLEGGTLVACDFEYGVSPFGAGSDTPYGLDEKCSPTPSGSGDIAESLSLTGLASGTKYYFRILIETTGGYYVGSTLTFTTPKSAAAKPSISSLKASTNSKKGTAKFTFKGSKGTTKYECALVTVNAKGKAGTAHYKSCKSPKSYSGLAGKSYEFLVKAGSKAGYGSAKTKKFKG